MLGIGKAKQKSRCKTTGKDRVFLGKGCDVLHQSRKFRLVLVECSFGRLHVLVEFVPVYLNVSVVFCNLKQLNKS